MYCGFLLKELTSFDEDQQHVVKKLLEKITLSITPQKPKDRSKFIMNAENLHNKFQYLVVMNLTAKYIFDAPPNIVLKSALRFKKNGRGQYTAMNKNLVILHFFITQCILHAISIN